MKAPHTLFSTELRGGKRLLKVRLRDLFAPGKRRGVLPFMCILLLVSMLGSLVACDTPSVPSAPIASIPPSIPVYKARRPPRYRKHRLTPRIMPAVQYMFLRDAAMSLQERFFCIMPWSRPVIATVRKTPARNCLKTLVREDMSVSIAEVYPSARILSHKSPKASPVLSDMHTMAATTAASMKVVYTASVHTIVLTPPLYVYR